MNHPEHDISIHPNRETDADKRPERGEGTTRQPGKSVGVGPAIAYIAVIAVLCLVPSVGLLFGGGEVSPDSDAAPAPRLTTVDGGFNFDVMADAGDWFDDHFAFRNEYVTVAAAVESVFGVSPNDSVVTGTNGWLYYGDSVDDFRGTGQLSDRALYDIAHTMKLVQTYALGRGVDFAFTISPNKNTLYGENMPYYYQVKADDTNLDRIVAVLEEEGVNYVDARSLLEGSHEVLYHRRDSHWNNEGAAMVADALMTALAHGHRDYSDEPKTVRDDFTGDLDKMLFPSAPTPEAEVYYDAAPQFDYVTEGVESNFDPKIETSSAAEGVTGSLVMYRDSFGNSLLPFMAEGYASAYFSRGVPYQLAIDLDAHDADALVIERAQRFMRDMAANAPVMPAPLMLEGELPADDGFEAIDGVIEDAVGDYLTVTGDAPVGIAPGERIAIRLNDTLVYEAFGVCDAETGRERFQLTVPLSVVRESGNEYEMLIW